MFQLNVSVIIRVKEKNSTKTLTLKLYDTRQWMSLEVTGWWELALLPSGLLINVVQQPGISSPLPWSKRSSAGVIWMCGPPSVAVPLTSGPVQHWCLLPVDGVVVLPHTLVPSDLTSPSFPSHRHHSALSVWPPVPCSSNVTLAAAAGDKVLILGCLPMGGLDPG